MRGNSTHFTILMEMFDWADAHTDWAYYEDALQDRCDTEFGTYGGGELVVNSFTVKDLLRRYGNPDHPADLLYDGDREGVYRYVLKLNPVGRAFLTTDEYLHDRSTMFDFGLSDEGDDEDDEDEDDDQDDHLQRARTIIRAWRFGWELVEQPTTCSVHNSVDDPEKVCGKRIEPGDGFRRWESDERRVVTYCWTCLPDLWIE